MNGWPIDFLYENAAIVRTFERRRAIVMSMLLLVRHVELLRVVARERAHHRRQHRHRVGGRREAVEEALHVLVDQRVARQQVREAGQLLALRAARRR